MVLDLIRTKRAVREFKEDPVPEEIIREVANAGRRAQSSRNSQPWHFIIVRDRQTLRSLSGCGRYAEHVAKAAFAIALVSTVDDHFDTGQAAAYMQLAAWEFGVGSCIATLHDPACARAVLGVPEGMFLDTVLSFGYPTESPRPPKPGGRKPFEEVVHWEKFAG